MLTSVVLQASDFQVEKDLMDGRVLTFNGFHYGGVADEMTMEDPPAGQHTLFDLPEASNMYVLVTADQICFFSPQRICQGRPGPAFLVG